MTDSTFLVNPIDRAQTDVKLSNGQTAKQERLL